MTLCIDWLYAFHLANESMTILGSPELAQGGGCGPQHGICAAPLQGPFRPSHRLGIVAEMIVRQGDEAHEEGRKRVPRGQTQTAQNWIKPLREVPLKDASLAERKVAKRKVGVKIYRLLCRSKRTLVRSRHKR